MNSKTILVVEDEELLRNAIVFQFKREGFNVLSACNGKEAFEIIKTNHIDAVVSDILMPGGNGIELLKNVKEYNANIPVMVFITAFADISESVAYDLGANAIFSKPFDRKALVGCIKKSVAHDGRIWKAENVETEPVQKMITSEQLVTLGRGGAFIESESPDFNIGETISVDVPVKFGNNITHLIGIGKVRWNRSAVESLPPGIGIEFLTLTSDSRDEFDKWLNENMIKPYIPLKAS